MSVIAILIIVSLMLAGGFLAAFFWAVRSGAMDDMHTPALRVLSEDGDEPLTNTKEK